MRTPTLLVALAVVLGAAGCGGGAREVARVGDRSVTQRDVQRLLDHGREEAKAEGRAFPEPGTEGYRSLERQALAILVERARVEAAAARLGVTVSDGEVSRALGTPPPRRKEAIELAYERARAKLGIAEAVGDGAALADATRLQLTLRKLVARLGADGVEPWLERVRARTRIRYAGGWAPR